MDFNPTKFSLSYHILLVTCTCSLSCIRQSEIQTKTPVENNDSCNIQQINIADSVFDLKDSTIYDTISAYYQMLESIGAVQITKIDSTIKIDLKYSGTDNFLNSDLYGAADKAYLQKDAALALSVAQSHLKMIDSNLGLIVYDALRPLSVQQRMWETFDETEEVKRKFLANPNSTSMHNFGLAVDVSIQLSDGTNLDMGTDFDDWSERSYPCLEYYLANKGLLGYNHVNNRSILRFAMELAGFTQNKYEWWHFYFKTKPLALAQFPIVESFNSISQPQDQLIVSTKTELIFSVQLAASTTRLNENSLCYHNIRMYRHDNMYKYCAGSFENLESAYKFRDSLLSNSCKNAFVVTFYNGERIPIQQALSLKEAE